MNVKQLETFVWIVRLGSFSAAAERLHTTQSTVSTRIRELEQTLGVSLFDRTHYRARLTAKGRELVGYAERIIDLTADARRRIGDPASHATVIRMGVAEMIAITWLPKLLVATRRDFPNVSLEVDLNLASHLIRRLRNEELDLILIPGHVDAAGLPTESIGHVHLAWMASPALGILDRRLGPMDLREWPIITLAKESNFRRLTEAWFGDIPVDEFIAVTHNNISVVAAMTMAGLGLSLLPPVAYESEIAAGRLCVLETEPEMPTLELFVVLPSERPEPLAESIAALAKRASEFGDL